MKDLTNKESAAPAAPTSAASPPQPRRASGATSAAPTAPSLGVFYYFLGTAALFAGFLVFYMVERLTQGCRTYWNVVPAGLAFLFRFRYCLFVVPLVLFALGRLSSRVALFRKPISMAITAAVTLWLFLFATLMLATPGISMLPIDYDLETSATIIFPATSPPQGGPNLAAPAAQHRPPQGGPNLAA